MVTKTENRKSRYRKNSLRSLQSDKHIVPKAAIGMPMIDVIVTARITLVETANKALMPTRNSFMNL